MTFTAVHTRSLEGADITVTVKAGDKESLAAVSVTLDGDELENLECSAGTEEYTRSFSQVGDARPGLDHTLIVTAMDASGAPHGATTRWSDD